jgi:hypothetical protein
MINSTTLIAIAVTFVVVLLLVIVIRKRSMPRELNSEYFQLRWKELQKMCSDKKTWALAIIDADKLLDEALKQSKFRGKTMGERLVTAQHSITNNDAVWFAHKLRNKLVHEEYKTLKQQEVKDALVGFRQALKDLGALK